MTSRPLSEQEIATALSHLAEWEHQVDSLARLVPTDRVEELRMVIEQVSGPGREHVASVPTPNGLVVKVSTPEVDAVTAQDVELAARIEQIIDEGGAQAVPGG